MNQLPIFVNLYGRKVVLVGKSEAAEAKKRLIERAGGICVGPEDQTARLAFVAHSDPAEAAAASDALKAKGLLVNVVDQPEHCDFTTPAIIDRDPVLLAIGTGGASAGLAKALRQKLEQLLPDNLGELAKSLHGAREKLRERFPDSAARRKAIDAALEDAGILDADSDWDVEAWLDAPDLYAPSGLVEIVLASADPDDLTLRQARLLGQADHIFHGEDVPDSILSRARADAVRHTGTPSGPLPAGLVLDLRLQSMPDHRKGRV